MKRAASKRPDVAPAAPPTKQRKPPVRGLQPDANTLPGRIDMMLQRLGMTRGGFTKAMHVNGQYLSQMRIKGSRMGPKKLLDAAHILGVDPEWLANGGSAEPVINGKPGALAPRANGTHHVRGDAVAHERAMNAIISLCSVMPLDAKLLFVEQGAALLVQHIRSN